MGSETAGVPACAGASGDALASGSHIPSRVGPDLGERRAQSAPDLRLPLPIKILDGILEPGFARWCEDRNDAQAEAQADHAAETVSMLVGPLKPIVVVERA